MKFSELALGDRFKFDQQGAFAVWVKINETHTRHEKTGKEYPVADAECGVVKLG